MTPQPTIIILEDERPQLLAVRAALHGLGDLKEFDDPNPALAFVKEHTVDAAIVDIHMPRFQIDGMEFVRAVRKFDRDLCVIIRTGDDSPNLADGAIEVRAFRRAIKGKTTIDELRRLTLAAVHETRDRRQISMDAANTSGVKKQWVQTLGSFEEAVSVTDSYRAVFQAMRNRLTALAGFAEVLNESAQRGQSDGFREHARKNTLLVGDLLGEVNAFLDGPFAEPVDAAESEAHTAVNGVLASLQKHFAASSRWERDGKTVTITGLDQDTYVAASAVRLLTAIRHLIEFCLQRAPSNSTTRLIAYCVANLAAEIDSVAEPKLVFTERTVSRSGMFVCFRVSGPLAATSLEDIRSSFRNYPADPRTGNLQMLPLALRDALAAVVVYVSPPTGTVFEVFVPVSR